MHKLLSLVFGQSYWQIHSLIIKGILRFKGVRVGRHFTIRGIPNLKIMGKAENIILGDRIIIDGDVNLKNRENGRIIIESDTQIEHGCSLIAAREGTITIRSGVAIGPHAFIVGGANITIGKGSSLAPNVSVLASEHITLKGELIHDQGFLHAPITIGDDCLIGTNVAIKKGVHIATGSVIGANAVVTKNTTEYSINVGVPAKFLKMRT